MKNIIPTYCAVQSDNYGARTTTGQWVGRTSGTYIRAGVRKVSNHSEYLEVAGRMALILGRSCDRPPRHRFFSVSLCL